MNDVVRLSSSNSPSTHHSRISSILLNLFSSLDLCPSFPLLSSFAGAHTLSSTIRAPEAKTALLGTPPGYARRVMCGEGPRGGGARVCAVGVCRQRERGRGESVDQRRSAAPRTVSSPGPSH